MINIDVWFWSLQKKFHNPIYTTHWYRRHCFSKLLGTQYTNFFYFFLKSRAALVNQKAEQRSVSHHPSQLKSFGLIINSVKPINGTPHYNWASRKTLWWKGYPSILHPVTGKILWQLHVPCLVFQNEGHHHNHKQFRWGKANPLVDGHNLLPLIDIGLMYLKIQVRRLPCLPYHWLRPWGTWG